jgi:hypothetical protein
MRPLLLVPALALVAVPAHAADPLQVCTTNLRLAPAGTSASCATKGPGPIGNKDVGVLRTATVVVAGGAVDATLTCGGSSTGPVHVTTTAMLSQWDSACVVSLTATVDGTTAVATSTFSFVFILPS